MRTTLDIEDVVLHAIKELARREGRSVGAVASDLLRRALSSPAASRTEEQPARYGFRPFVSALGENSVTNCQVTRLRDDLGI